MEYKEKYKGPGWLSIDFNFSLSSSFNFVSLENIRQKETLAVNQTTWIHVGFYSFNVTLNIYPGLEKFEFWLLLLENEG